MAKKKKKPVDKTAAARQGVYRSKNVTITLPKAYVDALLKLSDQYGIEAKTPTDLRRSVVIRLIESAVMVTGCDDVIITADTTPEVAVTEDKQATAPTVAPRLPRKKQSANSEEENLSLFDLL